MSNQVKLKFIYNAQLCYAQQIMGNTQVRSNDNRMAFSAMANVLKLTQKVRLMTKSTFECFVQKNVIIKKSVVLHFL